MSSETAVEELQRIVKEIGDKANSLEAQVISQKGTPMTPDFNTHQTSYGNTYHVYGELTQKVKTNIETAINNINPKTGNCWYNAKQIATQVPEITYTEGYGSFKIPMKHGWVTYENTIIEPTTPMDAYMGVKIPSLDTLNSTIKRNWEPDKQSLLDTIRRFSNIEPTVEAVIEHIQGT